VSESRRVEAFSDGVLAIAITLLVLDLKVPAAAPGELWRALGHEGWSYAAYVTSFLVIGIMWVNHHAIFDRIGRINRPVLFLNLFLLLVIAAIPYPTSLLAGYLRRGGENAKVAAVVYSGTMLLAAIAFSALWGYVARRPQLLAARVDPVSARASIRRFSAGTLVYLGTVGLALVSAQVTLVVHFLIAIFYVFNQIPVGERVGPAESERMQA
jgi:uncharacterized membrane protein